MPYSQSYPASLDAFPDPLGTDPLALSNLYRHSEYHEMHSSAIEALQLKLGIDNSLDTASFDYKLRLLQARFDPWKPTGVISQSLRRTEITTASLAAIASGALRLDGIFLEEGELVSNIAYWTGGTAANTPTNWWYAFYAYDASAPVFLGQTADQTTTPMAANSKHQLALTSPVAAPATGLYYTAIMVVAAVVPTFRGMSNSLQFFNEEAPVLGGQTTDTGLATTAPSPSGAIVSKEEFVPFVQVS